MIFDVEAARRALNKFLQEEIEGRRKSSLHRWCIESGIKSDSSIRKFLAGGSDNITTKTLMKLASGAGITTSMLLGEENSPKVVPLISYVGAGGEVFPLEDNVIEYIKAPEMVKDIAGLVACQVRGDSMQPKYEDGDIIFYYNNYDFLPEDCLNKVCVVKILNGPTLIKKLLRGSKPDKYTLFSYNASLIQDVEIEWAAKVAYTEQK
jgi:SOS-response transcriptional repressor LexA